MIVPLRHEPGRRDPPRFYGVAWEDPLSLVVHAFPIPVNLVVRWWLGFWRWCRWSRGNTFERLLWEAERRGEERGRRRGWDAGHNQGWQDGRDYERRLTMETVNRIVENAHNSRRN